MFFGLHDAVGSKQEIDDQRWTVYVFRVTPEEKIGKGIKVKEPAYKCSPHFSDFHFQTTLSLSHKIPINR